MRAPQSIKKAAAELNEGQKKLKDAAEEALNAFLKEEISLEEALEAVNAWNAAAPLSGMRCLHPLMFLRSFGASACKHPLAKSRLEIFVGSRSWDGKIYKDAVYLDGEKVHITDDMIRDHELRTKI